jgi:hypothetical protein
MDDFRMILTVLSMVLGLGVTRVLLGLVTVFRTRHASRVDWLPLCWAGVLFAVMLEYWWAINQLPLVMTRFSFLDFIYLVVMTMMLFMAAALLLPSRAEDEQASMRTFFEREGRFGLIPLSGFLVLAFVANAVYFHSTPLSTWGLLDIPMIAIPLAAFLARERPAQVWLAAAYVPLVLVDIWVSLSAS